MGAKIKEGLTVPMPVTTGGRGGIEKQEREGRKAGGGSGGGKGAGVRGVKRGGNQREELERCQGRGDRGEALRRGGLQLSLGLQAQASPDGRIMGRDLVSSR